MVERQDIHRRKVILANDLWRRKLETGLWVGMEWRPLTRKPGSAMAKMQPSMPSPSLPSPLKVVLCMPLNVLDMAHVCVRIIYPSRDGHNGCLSSMNEFPQDVHVSP